MGKTRDLFKKIGDIREHNRDNSIMKLNIVVIIMLLLIPTAVTIQFSSVTQSGPTL